MAEWTEARHKAFIIAALRSATRRYPPKYETLNEAKVGKKVNVKTGRLAEHYLCAMCKEAYPAKDINVDHIVPVVGPEGFVDWNTYIPRMFCSKDNLQTLCTTCHTAKSKGERLLKSTVQLKPQKAKSSLKASSTKKKPTS